MMVAMENGIKGEAFPCSSSLKVELWDNSWNHFTLLIERSRMAYNLLGVCHLFLAEVHICNSADVEYNLRRFIFHTAITIEIIE